MKMKLITVELMKFVKTHIFSQDTGVFARQDLSMKQALAQVCDIIIIIVKLKLVRVFNQWLKITWQNAITNLIN